MAAYAHQRRGELDQALEMYEALERAQPHNKAWSLWARNLRLRRGAQRMTRTTGRSAAATGLRAESAAAPDGDEATVPPPLSWSSFAGEFLAGALAEADPLPGRAADRGQLDRRRALAAGRPCSGRRWASVRWRWWRPRCSPLLGAGLVRWGADRAGRMMLIATLIVVPIHFMLAGELKLLLEPPSPRHLFLAIDALALSALVRWVSGMLARRRRSAIPDHRALAALRSAARRRRAARRSPGAGSSPRSSCRPWSSWARSGFSARGDGVPRTTSTATSPT